MTVYKPNHAQSVHTCAKLIETVAWWVQFSSCPLGDAEENKWFLRAQLFVPIQLPSFHSVDFNDILLTF